MDATCLDSFVDALIDELAAVPSEVDVGPSLGRLVRCARPVVDDETLLGVLAAAVSARNLLDFVIASAVAAAERAGVPGRRHLRTGTDVLRLLGMSPGAAARAVRVGR
ncbi:HNH endonuclease, partial [Mycolicibacterium sp. 22603]